MDSSKIEHGQRIYEEIIRCANAHFTIECTQVATVANGVYERYHLDVSRRGSAPIYLPVITFAEIVELAYGGEGKTKEIGELAKVLG